MMSMDMYRPRRINPCSQITNESQGSDSGELRASYGDSKDKVIVRNRNAPCNQSVTVKKLAELKFAQGGPNEETLLCLSGKINPDDSTRTTNVVLSEPQGLSARNKTQRQCRHTAISELKEFFQLQPSRNRDCSKASPCSYSTTHVPLQSIDIAEERLSMAPDMASRTPQTHDGIHIIEPFLENDSSAVVEESQTASFGRTFSRLDATARAQSLPLTQTTDIRDPRDKAPRALTKKPSLKQISTIRPVMPSGSKSEGNLLQRTVSFSSLSIREYPPALSDNPSCSFGPPVQLGWDFEAEETHPIDHYEQSRQPRRESHDLLLSYYDRRFLLLKQAGYSKREMKDTMKEVERVKRERMVTDIFLPAQALDETFESVVGIVKHFFRGMDKE